MLTEKEIQNAKPRSAPYRDGNGLFLLVKSAGKYWELRYRFAGQQKTLRIGVYPEVTAPKARRAAQDARNLLAEGADPAAAKKATKAAFHTAHANGFEVIAREWLLSRAGVVGAEQIRRCTARMEKDVFPWLGNRPVSEISAPEVLAIMRRVDGRGARYTAHKVKTEISQVMRYAIATGRAERDPCPDLRGAIPPPVENHRAAIVDPAAAAELLRAIDGFKGTFPVQCALKLAPMLFCRPGELRKMKWAELDLDAGDWRYIVPKTKTPHLVPLATQAVAILRELQPLTGRYVYVFPGARDPKSSMSEAAINAALRRMGYDTKTEITGHGFRAMARTILAERLRMQPEVIEHQLAHKVPDALGTAYNRTKYIDDRIKMMQIWADYLENLKSAESNLCAVTV